MNTRPTPSVVTDDGLVERLLRAWQTERSEWHGPVTLEVVREYAEWREAASDRDVLVELARKSLGWFEDNGCAGSLQIELRAALIPLAEEL